MKILLTLLLTASVANASFLIEPYLGMHFNSEADSVSSGDNAISGQALGARFGWQQLGLQLGANYKMGAMDIERDNLSDLEGDYSHFGLFVGYEFPILVRAWAEYILMAEYDIDGGGTFEKGSGTTIGFGYTGLPFVAINFEMGNTQFDEDNNGNNIDVEFDTYMLSVSLPLNF